MRRIEVIWVDACIEEAHIPLSGAETLTPLVRRNVGYVVREDAEAIIIQFGIIENIWKGNSASDIPLCIPKGMVKEIKELKECPDDDIIDDGFGASASAYCPKCKEKSMFVCRPGDIRCSNCDG